MINIEYLIITYLIGLFVDWIFQLDWQAVNKSKWGKNDVKIISLSALLTHSAVYSILTTLIVSTVMDLNTHNTNIMCIVLFTSHAIIDTRIPVKLIMKFKGMTNDQINDYANFGFMHIGIDHRLHELVIFILSMII